MNPDFTKENEFSKKEIFEEKVLPAYKELLLLCDEYQIPIFISLVLENTKNSTTYKNEMISATALGYNLANDQLLKHTAVVSGFDVVPHFSAKDFLHEEAQEEDMSVFDVYDVQTEGT